MPLQPGATFGGVLDFRPPTAQLPSCNSSVGPGAAGGVPGPAPAGRFPVSCHDVVVLLESEELVAPECRLGNQVGREAVDVTGYGNAAAALGGLPRTGSAQRAHGHIELLVQTVGLAQNTVASTVWGTVPSDTMPGVTRSTNVLGATCNTCRAGLLIHEAHTWDPCLPGPLLRMADSPSALQAAPAAVRTAAPPPTSSASCTPSTTS